MIYNYERDQFLMLVSEGVGKNKACRALGVSPSTITCHLEVDEAFRVAFVQAQAIAIETIEEAAHSLAKGGNLNAIKYFLNNRKPEQWQEARLALGVGTSNNIQINVPNLARQIAENPEATRSALQALNPPKALPLGTDEISVPTPKDIALRNVSYKEDD